MITDIRITRLVVSRLDYDIADMGLEETLGTERTPKALSIYPLAACRSEIE